MDNHRIENSIVFYLFLCLAAMNFFEAASIVWLLICLGFLFRMRFRILIDKRVGYLVVFAFCVLFSTISYGWSYTNVIKAMNYPLGFIVGMCGFQNADDKIKFVKWSVFSLFLGLLIQLGLDYIYNFNQVFSNGRQYYSVWTGAYISVTLIGLLCSGIIGYSFYGIFINKNMFIKLVSILGLVLTVVINLFTATRTPIVLMAVCYLSMFGIRLTSSNVNKKRIMIGAALLLVLGILVYQFDIMGIASYVKGSALFNRMSERGVRTTRTELIVTFYEGLFLYPLGGKKMSDEVGILPHNFIQEAGDAYGIVAFIALLFFFIIFGVDLVGVIRKRDKEDYHYLLISFSLALFIQSCLEPIISGYPMIIWSLLFVYGMMNAILQMEQEEPL